MDIKNKSVAIIVIAFASIFLFLLASVSAVPSFTTIPTNATGANALFYNNQSLLVTFNGSPINASFGYYSINDTTKFAIVQSGTNATLNNTVSLPAGSYAVNVTINDSTGNINWTIFLIKVNKANYYDCAVYFDNSSTVTYPAIFTAYTNCSSILYNLSVNSIPIGNATNITSGAGTYNISVQRNDTANYSNTFNQFQFVIAKNSSEKFNVSFNETTGIYYPHTFLVWANSTTPFVLKRNDTVISNNSEQKLSPSAYNFSASRNDSQNYSYYYSESEFRVMADTTHPAFTTDGIPSNAFLFYNVPLSAQFNATDDVGFGFYTVNDTENFTITQAGVLSMKRVLAPGNYSVNVIINDTSNNTNSTTFKLQVNKSLEKCQVLFSVDSPISYGTKFTVWQNCSSAATLSKDGVPIDNDTTYTALGIGKYNFSVNRTDTANYTYYYNDSDFVINTLQVSNGGGGGGTTTYTVTGDFLTVGDSFDMAKASKVSFSAGGESHSLKLSSFSSTTATVVISSNPITVSLVKGIVQEFDLNGDNVNDIRVRYDGIVDSKAQIFLQKITPIVEETGNTVSTPEETTPTETPAENTGTTTPTEETPTPTTTPTSNNNAGSTRTAKIVVFVALMVLLAVVLFFSLRKKHKRAYASFY